VLAFASSLLLLLAILSFIGGGWAKLISSRTTVFRQLPVLILAQLLAILEIAVVWIWIYSLNGGIHLVNSLVISITILGYALAPKKSRLHSSSDVKPSVRVSVISALLLVLVASFPAYQGLGSWSYPVRIGPDAVAYATAARVVQEVPGYATLKKQVESTSGIQISELLDTEDPKVYSLASYSDQITTEILIGAHRYASVGLVALVTQISGDGSAFAVMNLLVAVSVFLSIGICRAILRSFGYGKIKTWLLSCTLAISPVILVAWHEGFFAHLLALPFAVLGIGRLFSLSSLTVENGSEQKQLVDWQFLVAITGMCALYPDYLLFLAPFLVFFLGLMLGFSVTRSTGTLVLKKFLVTGPLSLMFLAPFVFPLGNWVLARLSQVKINGYWQPTWISPLEALGLFNAYTGQRIFLAVKDNQIVYGRLTEIFLWSTSAIFLALITRGLRKSPGLQSVNLALFMTMALIAIQNIQRDLNNYQFFKAMSFGLPILIFVTAAAWDFKVKVKIRDNLALVIVFFLMTFGTLNYMKSFNPMRDSHTYSQAIAYDAQIPESRRQLEDYNLIAKGDHIDMGSLVNSANVYWLHRGMQGYQTDFSQRTEHPLGWIIFNDKSEYFECVTKHAGVPAVDSQSGSFKVYEIKKESGSAVLDPGKALDVLDTFFKNHQLGDVASGWQSSKCLE
jgi:hypothetical protein